MMTEKEMVYIALTGWINHVETGKFAGMDKKTLVMLAGEDKDIQRQVRQLPELSVEQEDFVKQMRVLANKVITGELTLQE
jgi:hypothetical protein